MENFTLDRLAHRIVWWLFLLCLIGITAINVN